MTEAAYGTGALIEAIRSLEHRASALQQIAEFVRVIADADTVLQRLLVKVAELASADAGVIALAPDGKDSFDFVAAHWQGLSQMEASERERLLKLIKVRLGEGVVGQVLASGEPVILPKTDASEVFRGDVAREVRYDVRNLIAVPIVIDDRRLGVLELFNKKPEGSPFTSEDAMLLSALSAQIALVIEAHRLREESARQVEELTVLLKALETVNSSLALDTVLDHLMTMACQMLGAEAASVLLMDDELGQLYFAAATGVKKEEIKRVYLKKGEGIAGFVAERGETLLIPDVSLDERFSKKADQSSGFRTRSIVAVPIKTEGRLIGVAEAINKREGTFSEQDAQLLSTLASYGAVAIKKAQLYHDVNDLFVATVRALADAIEAKDANMRGRAERIRKLASGLAAEKGLKADEVRDVELAALLHDIGKISVPDQILSKQENLTEDEYRVIMRVPVIAAEIVSPIKQLRPCLPMIRHVNERWDGRGYPDHLSGEDIPLGSRIIAVAATYEALTSERPYRKALPDDVALRELASFAGTQFDPGCVETFIRAYRKGRFKNLMHG